MIFFFFYCYIQVFLYQLRHCLSRDCMSIPLQGSTNCGKDHQELIAVSLRFNLDLTRLLSQKQAQDCVRTMKPLSYLRSSNFLSLC